MAGLSRKRKHGKGHGGPRHTKRKFGGRKGTSRKRGGKGGGKKHKSHKNSNGIKKRILDVVSVPSVVLYDEVLRVTWLNQEQGSLLYALQSQPSSEWPSLNTSSYLASGIAHICDSMAYAPGDPLLNQQASVEFWVRSSSLMYRIFNPNEYPLSGRVYVLKPRHNTGDNPGDSYASELAQTGSMGTSASGKILTVRGKLNDTIPGSKPFDFRALCQEYRIAKSFTFKDLPPGSTKVWNFHGRKNFRVDNQWTGSEAVAGKTFYIHMNAWGPLINNTAGNQLFVPNGAVNIQFQQTYDFHVVPVMNRYIINETNEDYVSSSGVSIMTRNTPQILTTTNPS